MNNFSSRARPASAASSTRARPTASSTRNRPAPASKAVWVPAPAPQMRVPATRAGKPACAGLYRQRRSQNEAEETSPPPKNLLRFFAGVLYQSQLFENKRKEQSHSCSVVFSH